MIGKAYLRRVGGYDPGPSPVPRSAFGTKLRCSICTREFYVYRSDIHPAAQVAAVKFCPFCGGKVA